MKFGGITKSYFSKRIFSMTYFFGKTGYVYFVAVNAVTGIL